MTRLPSDADFIALDFETANRDQDSACSIGLAFVKDGSVVANPAWLICPPRLYFDPEFIKIHGIRPEDVEHQPSFADLWPMIKKFLVGCPVIAHNAEFDIKVLTGTLDRYRLPHPNLNYSCTLRIARKTWPTLRRYNLAALAEHHGITFNHHNAGEDACTCAQIALQALNHYNVDSFDQLNTKLCITFGQVFPGGHTPIATIPPAVDFTSFGDWNIAIHSQLQQQSRLERSKELTVAKFDPATQAAVINGYTVTLNSCTCHDFTRRKLPCKHMYRLFCGNKE
ncbi:MAG: polymerase [Firmicutes bacterium]|nr:polymerase [Bacillota bacterium]